MSQIEPQKDPLKQLMDDFERVTEENIKLKSEVERLEVELRHLEIRFLSMKRYNRDLS